MTDILRKVELSELDEVMALANEASSQTFHPTPEDEVKEIIKKGAFFFILSEGEKAGIISYEMRPSSFYIGDVVVAPMFKGRGLATEALEELIQKYSDGKPVELVTHPKNSRAIAVYLKVGFEIVGWKDNYYGDGEPRIRLIKER